jgi:Bacterial alpha-L-rhamnosidase 6 hairpin glycosidase domain
MSLGLMASAGAQSAALIYQSEQYSVWPDRVVEGEYTADAVSSTEIVSNYPMQEGGPGQENIGQERTWKLDADLSKFPVFHSDQLLSEAIYNLSLEELTRDVSAEGTFDAGAKWPGVWTRDVSYSILLSLAAIDPQRAEASLRRKVKRERIVQDTGTGGSWPISTDRVCWALAAWEIYLVTGDRKWLQESSTIIKNSVRDDEQVVIDPDTGLARGESSFMDWREQTYPRWMEPADIYSSKDLGTNAVYYRVYRILAAMDRELGKPAQEWEGKADRIRNAMNEHLWMKDKGLYGQYLYGRVWQTLSPRSDALGEALSVLFDVPSVAQREAIMGSQPLMPYGIPTVYPETPNIPPYHNRSVWPFVQAFWNLAAAKEDDQAILLYGLASMYRSTALFLTNKENFVADTGSPVGTAVNSDRQLWSVAASLCMVYRVLFGMEFAVDGLHLHPVIPESMNGTRSLTNFHYRDAILSITVKGFGSGIRRVTLDGRQVDGKQVLIPANLSGSHSIVIELKDQPHLARRVNLVQNSFAPETPELQSDGQKLTWKAIEGADKYRIYRNGKLATSTTETSFQVQPSSSLIQFQVPAVSGSGIQSFLSAPVAVGVRAISLPAVSAATGTDSPAYVTLEQTGITGVSIPGDVPADGHYAIAFRYANGSGPVNTDNKCAVRTLFIDGRLVGPIVLPQRGKGEWDNWGLSNSQVTKLAAGKHNLELRLLPEDLNMDGTVNRALIQSAQLERID